MIDLETFHHFNYVKKEELTGSLQGMRYMLKKGAIGDEDRLMVTIWPGPYCYQKTPEELKQVKDFEFSPAGVNEAGIWLNEQFVEQKDLWATAKLV